MKKKFVYTCCILFTILILLVLFTFFVLQIDKFERKITPEAEVAPTPTASNNDLRQFKPVSWEQSDSGDGLLKFTITDSHIATKATDIDKNGFLEQTRAYYCYPGGYTEYTYPEFIDSNGNFKDELYLVVLDITVSNPNGATNKYMDSQGNWINHYDNPYIFSATGIGNLLDLKQLVDEQSRMYRFYNIGYYSLRNSCDEREDGYELQPGESVSFQIGYLMGNREDYSSIDPSDLVFGISNTLNHFWTELYLVNK